MSTAAQFAWSLVIAAVGIVAACGAALLLIPQLSLEAILRGGTIAFLSMAGVRLVLWWQQRRQKHAK